MRCAGQRARLRLQAIRAGRVEFDSATGTLRAASATVQRRSQRRKALWGLCVCAGAGLAGCANPSTYATPRSLPAGGATFLVAPEVSGFGGRLQGASDFARTVPVPPTLGLRYGLSERWDVGARLANLSASADLKWNFLRSQLFDAALAPGFQFYVVPHVGSSDVEENVSRNMPVTILHAPLLLGLNVARNFSIIPSFGVSYALADRPPRAASDIELSQVLHGLFGRAGLGLDLRLTPRFALHPEVSVLRGFGDSDGFYVFNAGLGLVFGKLAEY